METSATTDQYREHVRSAFQSDRIESKPISMLYRLSLTFVSALMILLPLIYIGIIGLTGYGVYYHATHHTAFLEGGVYTVIFAYLGPLVIGAILVLFLIKPLFVQPPKPPPAFVLEPGAEPLLEEFVDRIAEAVGASKPRQIELNCDVNAAAAFRKGFRSLFSQDLKLIIGLPFLSGLSVRSFGGVLAHEFGHFSQGAGMRLTYIIRSINGWFARVVHTRDRMDVWLAEAASSVDLRIGIILHLARLFVWLSRRVLWALMWIGHAISCFALRQMEYDADSYEVGFAGSDQFKQTSGRIQELGVGSQKAFILLEETWNQGRISSNLPDLIVGQTNGLSNETLEAIEKAQTTANTGLFDTHPCDTDRIKAAESLNKPGIFHLEEPASTLVEDFPSLCAALTRHHYEHTIQLKFNEQNLVSNEVLAGEEERMNKEVDAINFFFKGHLDHTRPIFLTSQDRPSDRPIAQLEEEVAGLAEEYESTFTAHDEAWGDWSKVALADQLLRAGFSLNAAEFGLQRADRQSSHVKLAQLRTTMDSLNEQLNPFDLAVKAWLTSAIYDDPDIRAEAAPWLAFGSILEEFFPDLHELEDLIQRSGVLLEQSGGEQIQEQHYNSMKTLRSKIEVVRSRLRPRLEATPYPFEHAEEGITLWNMAKVDVEPGTDQIVRVHLQGHAILKLLFRLYQRTMGQLAILGKQVVDRQTDSP
ncbi:MAG: M48 family metallopeptidase [Verrucomicrobiota bacterium]